jgi:hypothetical protein
MAVDSVSLSVPWAALDQDSRPVESRPCVVAVRCRVALPVHAPFADVIRLESPDVTALRVGCERIRNDAQRILREASEPLGLWTVTCLSLREGGQRAEACTQRSETCRSSSSTNPGGLQQPACLAEC